ncbi:hypothetical protein [Nostoc sp. C117]
MNTKLNEKLFAASHQRLFTIAQLTLISVQKLLVNPAASDS